MYQGRQVGMLKSRQCFVGCIRCSAKLEANGAQKVAPMMSGEGAIE